MKVISSILIVACLMAASPRTIKNTDLKGAWTAESDGKQMSVIVSEKYFALTTYSLKDKTFEGTRGGSWRMEGDEIFFTDEFNTYNPDGIGNEMSAGFELDGNKLIVTTPEGQQSFTRVDKGTPGKLAGAWLITGRMNNGEMQKMKPGVRRTMKILSGTRFQWIAYNTETKEFFGTGGGTYTTKNGKYTENIEFFSRDNSRVGMSLQFDFSLEDGAWRHKGLSSKGDPIDEVWTRREVLGI